MFGKKDESRVPTYEVFPDPKKYRITYTFILPADMKEHFVEQTFSCFSNHEELLVNEFIRLVKKNIPRVKVEVLDVHWREL